MKSWRLLTWIILVVQGLFALWMVMAMFSTADNTCDGEFGDACRAGAAIGLGIGLVIILAVWALTDIILGVIWIVTHNWMTTGTSSALGVARQAESDTGTYKKCPDCAEFILAEANVCRYCSHKFPTSNVRCTICSHVQKVPAGQTKYVCEQCGKALKRNAAIPTASVHL